MSRLARLHRLQFLRFVTMAALAVCLSGCTSLSDYVHNGFKVGPNYCKPNAPVAEHWIDAADIHVADRSRKSLPLVDRLPRSQTRRIGRLCVSPEPDAARSGLSDSSGPSHAGHRRRRHLPAESKTPTGAIAETHAAGRHGLSRALASDRSPIRGTSASI